MSIAIDIIVFSAAIAFMIIGLVAIVIPLIPGVLIIWLATLAYALQDDFTAPGPIAFGIITFIAAIAASADLWMSFFGAKVGGTSLWGMLAGAVLGVIGLIIFFPLGGIIGTTTGVALVEWIRSGDIRAALRSGGGTLGGWLLTTVFQLAMGIIIIIAFVFSVLIPLRF